ncbi:aspartate aminotransferase [Phaeobacter inhibens]|uniref:pyridoxal phosphate-dependent aminotransferase n=1 Tax=Phaeobacter inhibens TaxID=221822 RepID=UPI00276A410C|nr:pyridoxal phosphate-dependent aminotransferase [Phaeobacter inhibens]GLO71888.1 aspartate aminotransferase [Phaeobacter inhibens]
MRIRTTTFPASSALDDVPFSVFEQIVGALKIAKADEIAGLHQGKTTYPPCPDVRHWPDRAFEIGHNVHAPPQGLGSLKTAIKATHASKGYGTFADDQLMICCGATHGLKMAADSVLQPGDEALILSPQWLFAHGVLKSCNAVVRETPIFLELCKNPELDIHTYLEETVSPRTRLIYFNTPNNPTGYSMTRMQLQALVSFCRDKGIWLVADNAYEFYDYSPQGFIDARDLDGGDEITFSIYSFSKSYIMPGYRVGYLISPTSRSADIQKRGLHTVYSVATPSQYGAWQALKAPQKQLAFQHEETFERAQIAQSCLNVPHLGFSGGFYLFLDLSALGPGGQKPFYQTLLEHGISLAPGQAFGTGMENYARLCFTAVERDLLSKSIQKINEIYSARIAVAA